MSTSAASSTSQRKYDFVVFGATGVTGKRAAEELVDQQMKNSSNSSPKFAIAGRNEQRLKKVRSELIQRSNNKIAEESIGIIIADVDNHKSLVQMCAQGKVLLQVVGPYRFYGFKILDAAIEAKTNVVDVSGEPFYLEKSEFDYNDAAKKAGVTVIGSCGFDSIPADIGSLFLQKEFQRVAKATCVHVDSYVTIQSGKSGFVGHSTTYECAVHGMSQVKELSAFRKKVMKENPLPPRFRLPSQHFGIKKSFFQSFLPWFSDPRLSAQQKYCFMFPGADASIVRRSQTRILRQNEKENAATGGFYPLQYNAYFTVASAWTVVLLTLGGLMMGLMNKFSFTRNLLIKFPSFFTFGGFSHEGPNAQQLKETSFSMTMLGTGYSFASMSKQQFEEYLNSGKVLPKPDTKMKVVVSGPEAGYVATPIYLIEVAKLVLENSGTNKMQTGVFSPAAALDSVSDELVERLAKYGCKFESSKM